jgi:ABC-type transport system involved in multi-copper enzyme maturation permease subunit
MLNPKQMWQVCRFEAERRLRSVTGIAALVGLVLASAAVGHQLAKAARLLKAATDGEDSSGLEMMADMVAGLTEFPLNTVRDSLSAHSPPLVGAFAFLMFLMPLLAVALGYDQCASDIETRHARFLAFRIDRTSLYLGKLLGTWTLLSLTVAVATLSIAAYLSIGSGTMPSVSDLAYLGRIIATVSVSALPLLTFFGLLGSLRGTTRRLLLFAALFWLTVSVVAASLRHGFDLPMFADVVDMLWPTHGRWPLVLDERGSWLVATTKTLVYAGVTGGLGLLHFRKRDL